MFEIGRATQLTHALLALKAGAILPPALAEEDRATRKRLQRAQRRVADVSRMNVDGDLKSGAASDLEAAWDARDRVVASIAKHSRRNAMAARIRPIQLEAFRAWLEEDRVYVAYDTSPDADILAMVIDNNAVTFHSLDTNEGLSADVVSLRNRLSTPDADSDTLARRLYKRLVEPLEGRLKGKTHLLISPDGALAMLPFDALMPAKGGRLVQSHAISFVPSATAAVAFRAPREEGRGVLAVANPPSSGGYAPLPASINEVRALEAHFEEKDATMLIGAKATVENVSRAFASAKRAWRVAHFACHGVLDADRADGSGLVLANELVWNASAIATMRAEADLVVLSACNTARGVPRWGEGLLGLSRAFLWSGARQVIASAWRVEDTATAQFFKRFYEAHLGRGLSASSALQSAKLEAIASKGADAAPHVWAAFLLWND